MYDDCMILSLRFPQKLWRIVNECESGAIRWSLNGNTILLDYKKFQEQYLDPGNSIFKTKNITSFIRQLNLYGFRKVTSHNRDPICNSHNPDIHEFLHENFRTGQPDLLSMVCRKTAGKVKCGPRRDSRNIIGGEFIEKDTNNMSRLRMCRLALTEALEQIAQEYHRTQTRATSSKESFDEVKNSHETVADFFNLDLYTARSHESDLKWITNDSTSFSSESNTSGRVTYSWCIHTMDKHNPVLHFESTN